MERTPSTTGLTSASTQQEPHPESGRDGCSRRTARAILVVGEAARSWHLLQRDAKVRPCFRCPACISKSELPALTCADGATLACDRFDPRRDTQAGDRNGDLKVACSAAADGRHLSDSVRRHERQASGDRRHCGHRRRSHSPRSGSRSEGRSSPFRWTCCSSETSRSSASCKVDRGMRCSVDIRLPVGA